MLRKQYDTIYMIFAVTLCVLTTALFYTNMQLLSDLVIVFVPMFAVLYIFAFVLGHAFSVKLSKILIDECDPEKYLVEYDRFYKITANSINSHPTHYVNRYSAFTSLGKYDEARQIIESVPAPNIVKNQIYDALYYVNSANLHIFSGNFEEARQKLDCVRNMKIPKKHQSVFMNSVDGNEAEMLRKQGRLRESRKLFNELLQRETHKKSILNCVFALGLIDIEEQKYDEAKMAFKKVMEEGNKLYIVTLAKQELEKIQNRKAIE